jgi:hypothetical protein
MKYENLSADKKQIILDLAIKAIHLRPGLAGAFSGGEPMERAAGFAKHLAELIEIPPINPKTGFSL